MRLRAAVAARGPLCVGIDPHRSLLIDWGVGDDLDGLRRFTELVVEALAGSVAVLKPQMAFYERFGSRGIAVLEEAVAEIRAAGALVLLDAKRGDIGSTMDAYADYLRSDHPMQVDAMTVSPYLGPDSLEPAHRTAQRFGGGLFVLARTSNPDAGTFQHARLPDDEGGSVAQAVVDTVRRWNTPDWVVGDPMPTIADVRDSGSTWGGPTGSYGVVVGATLPRAGRRPRQSRRADPRARSRAPRAARRPTCAGCSAATAPSSPRSPAACSVPERTRARCAPPPTGGRRSSPDETAGAARAG